MTTRPLTPRSLIDSVRVRLTFTVTILFAGALALSAVGLVRQVEHALVNDVKLRNATVTQALGQLLSTDSVDALTDPAQVATGLSGTYNAEVLREGINDSLISVSGPGAANVVQDANIFDRIRRVVTGEATALFGKVMPPRIDTHQYVISKVRVDAPGGAMVLTVASSMQPISRTVDRLSAALVVAVPLLVLAVAFLTWVMTGRALRPVSAITSQARAISGSTLDRRVPEPQTDDEIGELARTVNAMLDRLQSASERQRQFVSDASHELRSPVASIRLQLETALMRPDLADWETVGRTVLAEDQRLASLVDNLLALARLEEGQRRPQTEVDLDEICYDQLARPRRVTVNLSGVLAGRVYGVPDELTSVVRNLIDNAERHASKLVKVSLATHGPWVRLAVEDDGPGVDPSLRDKVFERFARLQEARSRDAGGAGLGLALTKRIVEAHGGSIFIEDSSLGGASFVVELPSADFDPQSSYASDPGQSN